MLTSHKLLHFCPHSLKKTKHPILWPDLLSISFIFPKSSILLDFSYLFTFTFFQPCSCHNVIIPSSWETINHWSTSDLRTLGNCFCDIDAGKNLECLIQDKNMWFFLIYPGKYASLSFVCWWAMITSSSILIELVRQLLPLCGYSMNGWHFNFCPKLKDVDTGVTFPFCFPHLYWTTWQHMTN